MYQKLCNVCFEDALCRRFCWMKFRQRVNYGLQNAIKHPFLFLQRNQERTDDMILKFPVIDFEKASVLKLYYKTFKI